MHKCEHFAVTAENNVSFFIACVTPVFSGSTDAHSDRIKSMN